MHFYTPQMKHCLVVIFYVLFLSSAFAQIDSFSLADFKLTDVSRHEFNTSLGFGSFGSVQKNKGLFPSTFENGNHNLTLNGFYRGFVNTRKWQSDFIADFSVTPWTKVNEAKSEFKYFGNYFASVKYYLKPKFFIGGSANITSRVNQSGLRILSLVPGNQNFFSGNINTLNGLLVFNSSHLNYKDGIRFTAGVSTGIGRVEYVTDAQLGLYMLEDLKAVNRLNGYVTGTQINELGKLISETRLIRRFDRRLRRMEQIEILDRFFREQGLVIDGDAKYFTTLYDNWLFANNPNRFSGSRLTFGVDVEKEDYQFPITIPRLGWEENSEIVLSPYIRYANNKPLSLKWQRDYQASLQYATGNSDNVAVDSITMERSSSSTLDISNVNLNVGLSFGYFPTTRTSFRFGGNLSGGKDWRTITFTGPSKSESIVTSADLFFSAIYYISPQVRLNINGGLNMMFNEADSELFVGGPNLFKSSRTSHSLSLNFNYFPF